MEILQKPIVWAQHWGLWIQKNTYPSITIRNYKLIIIIIS